MKWVNHYYVQLNRQAQSNSERDGGDSTGLWYSSLDAQLMDLIKSNRIGLNWFELKESP